jgi:hypothetical protein
MTRPASRTPMAGGFLLALSVLIGVIAGTVQGQPSLGFVIGTGVGVALLLTVWLIDRRR